MSAVANSLEDSCGASRTTLSLSLCLLAAGARSQTALGTWSGLIDLGRRAIHVMMLKDGRFLVMNRTEAGQETFEPAIFKSPSGNYDDIELDKSFPGMDRQLFCSGHITGWDGTPYFFGGHKDVGDDQQGQKYITVLENDTFVNKTDMVAGRWYPSTLRLPNGDVMALMGHIARSGDLNNYPTIWGNSFPGQPSPGDYKYEFSTELKMDVYYPFVYILSDGRIYYAGQRFIDGMYDYIFDSVKQVLVGSSGYGYDSGVSVPLHSYPSTMRVDDIVVRSGGSDDQTTSDPAVDTAVYLDLNESAPKWRKAHTDQMVLPRKNHVMVGLPTGNVLVMNGNLKGNVVEDDSPYARTAPEVWDPFRPARPWTLLAQPGENDRIRRGYHGTAWLLPDARVASAGGDPINSNDPAQVLRQQKLQIYSPPYGGRNDWATVRPSIGTVPTEIYYGQSFSLETSMNSPKIIQKVILVGLPSVTHAYDQGGMVRSLSFSGSGSLTVQAPINSNIATPGYYMLYVVDNEGVDSDLSDGDQSALIPGIPSKAKIVRLGYGTPSYPEPNQIQLSGGSYYSQTPPHARELFLADNTYLGKDIFTGMTPTGTQLLVDSYAPAGTGDSKIHVLAEWLATSNSSFKIEAYDWTSGYQQLYYNSSLTANEERRIEADSTGSGDFINENDNRRVRLRLTWIDSDSPAVPFHIKLDQVRMWLR